MFVLVFGHAKNSPSQFSSVGLFIKKGYVWQGREFTFIGCVPHSTVEYKIMTDIDDFCE